MAIKLLPIIVVGFSISFYIVSVLAVPTKLPCSDFIYITKMSREENYWIGTLRTEKFKNLENLQVSLTLTAPAKVTLEKEDGRRTPTQNNSYSIVFTKKDDGTYRSKIRVQGRVNGKFPELADLHASGFHVCTNVTGKYNALTLQKNPQNRACGRRLVEHQGLITNGYPSREGDWPWHAAIYYTNFGDLSYKCGGTLITQKAVVTAGHCVTEDRNVIVPERILVRLGQYRLQGGSNFQDYRVLRIIPHEKYDPVDLRNDIAVLTFTTQVTFNTFIQPACLWDDLITDLDQVVDEKGYVVGWGFTENNVLSDVLSQGVMPVVPQLTCLSSNRPFYGKYLTENVYCAGFRNGTSVCNGDSGGGMFFKRDKVFKLRGIVSLSVSSDTKTICNTMEYVLFTDCAKYLGWIYDKIQ